MSTEHSVQGWFLAVPPARRGINRPRCADRVCVEMDVKKAVRYPVEDAA